MKEDKSQIPADDNAREVPREDAAKMTPLNAEEQEQKDNEKHQERRHSSAASINAIITSPTNAVRSRRHTDTLGNTGNNTSYEGPTSNAAGGTGYNSGQSATGETIRTTTGYDAAGMGHHKKHDEEEDDNEQEDKSAE